MMFSIIHSVHSKHFSTQFTYSMQMPRLSVSSRKRVVILIRRGYSLRVIRQRLLDEGNIMSLRSLQHLWSKFQTMHTVRDLPRATRPRLLTAEMILEWNIA